MVIIPQNSFSEKAARVTITFHSWWSGVPVMRAAAAAFPESVDVEQRPADWARD